MKLTSDSALFYDLLKKKRPKVMVMGKH